MYYHSQELGFHSVASSSIGLDRGLPAVPRISSIALQLRRTEAPASSFRHRDGIAVRLGQPVQQAVRVVGDEIDARNGIVEQHAQVFFSQRVGRP